MDKILLTIPSFRLLIFLILSAGQTATAQPQPADYEALSYRLVGPFRGGRVSAVAGFPSQPATFLMGSSGGGVWKTTDAGHSWDNISDGYFSVGSIGAIAVAPSDESVIYVGTGSSDPRGNVSPGRGIYKSIDGGRTWGHIGLKDAGQIGRIVFHPEDPDHVYVAVLGDIFGPSDTRGIYRTLNGGKDWERIHYIDDTTGAIELVMHPEDPEVLYAGMWRVARKPWTLIDGGVTSSVWRTVDGGTNWSRVTNGLPQGTLGRPGIAISPVNPDRIWVIQESTIEPEGGLYQSTDGGQSFQRINRNHDIRQRAWYYSRIFAHPTKEKELFVCNVHFFRSKDGGQSFERITGPHSDHHALWINPLQPDFMIVGNDGGATVSLNNGKTWSPQDNQPTAEIYRVATDQAFPYRLYGAQQDNSTISVPSKWSPDQAPHQQWYAVGGGESGHIAVDPRNNDLIYAGNYIGKITRRDRGRNHQRDVTAYPQMHDGTAPRDIRYRFQWNAPIRISPHDPDVVYHCSQYVHKSTDGGQTWEVISPDLTTNNDAYHDIPGGPIQHDHTGVELYTTIFAFEESPHQAGVLWAGTDDGRLHISHNAGRDWRDITPPGLPKEATINAIDLSAHGPGRALLTAYRYRQQDYRPLVYLTNDYGANWTALTNGKNGIPKDHFVRVVREAPFRKGLLFAGTEYGMYWSWNTGASWQLFQQNLPRTPITDLQFKEGDLVVATQGRSFWILDDLSFLTEWVDHQDPENVQLFSPDTALITQLGNGGGKGQPDPAPRGALITFFVPDSLVDRRRISLSIIDPDGKERVQVSNRAADETDMLRLRNGVNRWEWDLRYEKPQLQEGSVFSLANTGGVHARPGTHQVVLQVGDQRYRKSFEVGIDPRWTVGANDLVAQYELAMEAKNLLNACHHLIGQLRSAWTRLDLAKQDMNPQSSLVLQVAELQTQITALEEQLIQTKSESSQDPINYPPKLDDQIAYLYSIVNSQYARPTAGCYDRLEDLQQQFQAQLRAGERLLEKDIPQLAAQLKARGIDLPEGSQATQK